MKAAYAATPEFKVSQRSAETHSLEAPKLMQRLFRSRSPPTRPTSRRTSMSWCEPCPLALVRLPLQPQPVDGTDRNNTAGQKGRAMLSRERGRERGQQREQWWGASCEELRLGEEERGGRMEGADGETDSTRVCREMDSLAVVRRGGELHDGGGGGSGVCASGVRAVCNADAHTGALREHARC
eukprot:2229681-Rhodomonas_salina.1